MFQRMDETRVAERETIQIMKGSFYLLFLPTRCTFRLEMRAVLLLCFVPDFLLGFATKPNGQPSHLTQKRPDSTDASDCISGGCSPTRRTNKRALTCQRGRDCKAPGHCKQDDIVFTRDANTSCEARRKESGGGQLQSSCALVNDRPALGPN